MTHSTQTDRDFDRLDALSIKKNAGKLDIYVDGITGSDLNPGTQQRPMQTLSRAYELVPTWVTDRVIIHLAPHAGAGYVAPSMRKILQANVWVVSEDSAELLAVDASGGNTLRVDTTGMIVDEYRGKMIEILSGAAVGDRRLIRDNTATKISPVSPFSGAVASGDSFRVFEPVTRITTESDLIIAHGLGGQTPNEILVGPGVAGLFFENLVVVNAGDLQGSDSSVHFYGCVFTEAVIIFGGDTSWQSGTDKSASDSMPFASVVDRGALSQDSWYGWGCSHAGILAATAVGRWTGFWVGGGWTCFGGHTEINGGSFTRTSADCFGVFALWNGPCTLIIFPVHSSLDILVDVTEGNGFKVTSNEAYLYVSDVIITITTSGHGILVERGGGVEIDNINITTPEVGLKAQTGGTIRFKNLTGITVTATGNDTEAGQAPVFATMASYSTAGDFIAEVTSDGSVIQRHS